MQGQVERKRANLVPSTSREALEQALANRRIRVPDNPQSVQDLLSTYTIILEVEVGQDLFDTLKRAKILRRGVDFELFFSHVVNEVEGFKANFDEHMDPTLKEAIAKTGVPFLRRGVGQDTPQDTPLFTETTKT